MSLSRRTVSPSSDVLIPVETMRTLLVCRGPIAFETLEVYHRCGWLQPHVVVSSKEWIAELHHAAPWIADVPSHQVHYLQEYTDVEAILQIAIEHDIQAIYPGYGFLAENADFADRVEQLGVRFVGPTPNTLRAVGDKDSAIALAKELGIPTIPGDDQLVTFAQLHPPEATSSETVRRTLAMSQCYPDSPIRLKHPAGGGGKGQRVLVPEVLQSDSAESDILEALAKLWAEIGVSSAEEDTRKGVLLELNIPRPLHWEVQLFGDGETVVHFAARDCSLQNQSYQKFIELALHPAAIEAEIGRLDAGTDATRITSLRARRDTLERIFADALKLGQAIQLRGAATVEFLIDEQGEPYFLEVNPRIQVEHAVTEGIARVRGKQISLVELQQRVAAGERIDFKQDDITCTGDAIEVRLNAWHEDLSPVLGGVVEGFNIRGEVNVPEVLECDVRVDASGLLQRRVPWTVPSYDANFALIIVSGESRHRVLDGVMKTLSHLIDLQGNSELHTNMSTMLGLLAVMRALPPETAFRTDTSLLWMGLVAVVMAQQQSILSLLPSYPRQVGTYDSAQFARLLHHILETGFANPSRLLTAYVKRLMHPEARPLAQLEVIWWLASELQVTLQDEERQQGSSVSQAVDALYQALDQSSDRLVALCREPVELAMRQSEGQLVLQRLRESDPSLSGEDAQALLMNVLCWVQTSVPAVRALVEALERTQVHILLTPHDDLSLERPAYLQGASVVSQLHRLLSTALRPTMLRQGELLSPMEATIYLQPEPGTSSFVEVGTEIAVGQTLALLEAMKMFTELPSPVDGVVVDILVENGAGVKTGESLFKIVTQDARTEVATADLSQIVNVEVANRFRLLNST